MKKLIVWLFLAALFSGCAPALSPTATSTARSTQTPLPTAPAPTSPPTPSAKDELLPFLPALQTFAAQKFGANADEIKIIKIQPVEWPDACLGAAQPGEICAQVITPGYLLTLEIKGKAIEVHTDSGRFVRQATLAPSSGGGNPAAEVARLWMMDSLKVDANAIQITSVNPKDWPDGCLGVHKPGQACTAVIVPGYRVLLTANGISYELRISQDGKQVIVVDPLFQVSGPQAAMLERPQLTWKSGGQSCFIVQAMDDQAAYGLCNGALKIVHNSNPDRVKELVVLLASFQPFSAQTTAGQVAFFGGGKDEASPSQQRALAEWAGMLYQEISSGPSPDLGLALTWQRVGGIAGFCDDLKIYRSGLAVITSCKAGAGQPAYTRWLDSRQLDQFYGWLDTLQTGGGKQGDPAVADAMIITWSLTASGKRVVVEADRQAIFDLASRIVMAPK